MLEINLSWKFGKAFTQLETYLFLVSAIKKLGDCNYFGLVLVLWYSWNFPINTSLEEHAVLGMPRYLRTPSATAADMKRHLASCVSVKAQVLIQDALAF